MRISVVNTDSGYTERAFGAKVKLDGLELKNCFTADEEAGEVHCFIENPDGSLVVDNGLRSFKTEIKKGVVEVMFPKDSI